MSPAALSGTPTEERQMAESTENPGPGEHGGRQQGPRADDDTLEEQERRRDEATLAEHPSLADTDVHIAVPRRTGTSRRSETAAGGAPAGEDAVSDAERARRDAQGDRRPRDQF
jgi:hypothetical protein